jgi:hypothetical protein
VYWQFRSNATELELISIVFEIRVKAEIAGSVSEEHNFLFHTVLYLHKFGKGI